MNEAVHNM